MLLLSSYKCQNTIKVKITLGSHNNNMFYSRVGVGAGAGPKKPASAPPKNPRTGNPKQKSPSAGHQTAQSVGRMKKANNLGDNKVKSFEL